MLISNPSCAKKEISQLREVDTDMSGTIDRDELEQLRARPVRIGRGAKIMELVSTHPDMLKRIHYLSSLLDIAE